MLGRGIGQFEKHWPLDVAADQTVQARVGEEDLKKSCVNQLT
jgi:hypothetical protein